MTVDKDRSRARRRVSRRSVLALAAAAAAAQRGVAWAVPAGPSMHRLNLINAHTGEHFTGPFRNDKGPLGDALKELSHFLRDFHCGQEIGMDVALLDFVAAVVDSVGAARAIVLSAYRTPETNAQLARTTFGVAENSQHLYGRALDIYLPARLEDAMLHARAMKRGGVGWYPNSHFIHLDSGPVRNWTLTGHGFGSLLLNGKSSRFFPDSLKISTGGEFVSRRTGQPITTTDRLAIHQLVEQALTLAHRH